VPRKARDAELQGRVAFFFDRVGRAARMGERPLEFVIGPSASTEWADQVNVALRGQLLEDLPAIAWEPGSVSASCARSASAMSIATGD
jgi:hypothetical protein